MKTFHPEKLNIELTKALKLLMENDSKNNPLFKKLYIKKLNEVYKTSRG
jgi:hypothetical protein